MNLRCALSVPAILLMLGCARQQQTTFASGSTPLPECTIAARQAGDDIVVKVTIANHSQSPYRLLQWNLPLNGQLTTALFAVTHDGSPVEYKGQMVKRSITPDSYIAIAPNERLSTEISLQQGYNVRPAGHYAITYQAFNQRSDSSALDQLTSPTVGVIK